ncbi:class I tRNA ligase family protein [Hydrogenobacter sp. T-2]|uniref:class I tRNA ligase family protein n=1 Tax=Pampinifervens diazotrophicum TaxID=1632018 RepID=UPI002B25986B|nr:class I tRNA ligase family protein [Hydrogenobacter sp. T-2]WPM31522.1 class I tRNA ligase family protein [Hydrogenobacter sp. T-2]
MMKVHEFLKENAISIGDNFVLLLEKLNLEEERYIRKIEQEVGEPAKMSKSKGNTVDPEEAIKKYGADTVRLYILFAGPVEKDFEWTEEGVQGAYRFLRRLWALFHQHLQGMKEATYYREEFANLSGNIREIRHKTYQTLKRYLSSIEDLSFNTAIASIMELLNTIQDFQPSDNLDYKVLRESFECILFMLYPITPHICEELWQSLGYNKPMVFYPFPEPDEKALVLEELEIPVQVNGKLRAVIRVPVDTEEAVAKELALKDPKISQWLNGKEVRKVIYIKNKLLNLVV